MRRPNIVFIFANDMGYGDSSAFNGGLSNTPALDALMTEGVYLTQPTPWPSAARLRGLLESIAIPFYS